MIQNYISYITENKKKDLFNDEWKSKFDIKDGKIVLHHFGKSGIKEFDPSYWGLNPHTKGEFWWIKPRTYFYVNLDDKERVVAGSHYIVEYPLHKLYPFNLDPLNFYDECSKELDTDNIPIRRQVICISDKAHKNGFGGMIYKWEGSFVCVIWEKVNVTKSFDEDNDISDDNGNGKILIKNKYYSIPKSDRYGWEIVDGLSTDPRLSSEKEAKQRVIDTILSSL